MTFFHPALVYITCIVGGITLTSNIFTIACDIEVSNSVHHPVNNAVYRLMTGNDNGRPSYQHVGIDTSYLCYSDMGIGPGWFMRPGWFISLSAYQHGTGNAVIRALDTATTPDLVTTTWEEWTGEWVESSGLTVCCLIAHNTSSTMASKVSTTPSSYSTTKRPGPTETVTPRPTLATTSPTQSRSHSTIEPPLTRNPRTHPTTEIAKPSSSTTRKLKTTTHLSPPTRTRKPMTSPPNSPISKAHASAVPMSIGFAFMAVILLALIVILAVICIRGIKPLNKVQQPAETRPRAILGACGGGQLDVVDQNSVNFKNEQRDDPPSYTDLFP